MSGTIREVGDRALLLELGDPGLVYRTWTALRHDPFPEIEDVLAGAATVLVITKSGTDMEKVAPRLEQVSSAPASSAPGREFVIPVHYNGPDLEDVGRLTSLDAVELARRHAAAEYQVSFVGFSPGFAYLTGGDPQLNVPRLDAPRTSVPAGSVAIAAGMTAVYPQATPGGWRIIGRTDAVMFDPHRLEPSLLSPGDRVRFEAVGAVGPAPNWATTRSGSPRSGAYMRVLDAGPLTTVQDLGRPGWRHAGVPTAGAADRASAAHANRLVGNPPDAAMLEATLSGPHLRLGSDRQVAVTGARVQVTVDGIPARQDSTLTLPAGSEIVIGACHAGARVYIAVSGGVDVAPVLGSRATDTLSGVGPAPVVSGEVLPLGPARIGSWSSLDPVPRQFPRAGDLITVRARRGPRHSWVGDRGMEVIATEVFMVHSASDRTGVRLEGPVVSVHRQDDLPSEGMVPGAVQVPPSGQPIVLLPNHPTTGGYPVAAVVDDEGVDQLAQARPGVRVRFDLR